MPTNVDGNQAGHTEAQAASPNSDTSLQVPETSVADAHDPTVGEEPRPEAEQDSTAKTGSGSSDGVEEPAVTEPEGSPAEGAQGEPPKVETGPLPVEEDAAKVEDDSTSGEPEEPPVAVPVTPAQEEASTEQVQDSPVEAEQERPRQAEQAAAVGAGMAAVAASPAETEETDALAGEGAAKQEPDLDSEEKTRRRLLLTLLLLVLLLASAGAVIWRYIKQPASLPDLIPLPGSRNVAPHYLFSIYGASQPVGIALSSDGERIYVAETGGERLIQIFDRDGASLASFAPPRTLPSERSPVYLAVDGTGRVFVSDRLQHAVFVYDRDGNYLDTLLGPDLTLSEHVSSHTARLEPGTVPVYNRFEMSVYYQTAGEDLQALPAPDPSQWAPLGVRIDGSGSLLLTDIPGSDHVVREIPGDAISAETWQDFDPPEIAFGAYGQGSDQFMFPNAAVVDSLNRIHVTDGNNGRVSVWDRLGEFLFSFGQGTGEGAIGLPRGAVIDARDRLHVVDAVEQSVKVYDVSAAEPSFLFAFGDWGSGDGEFNYPNDIAMDSEGRLYIADRENNRIQVWSY